MEVMNTREHSLHTPVRTWPNLLDRHTSHFESINPYSPERECNPYEILTITTRSTSVKLLRV